MQQPTQDIQVEPQILEYTVLDQDKDVNATLVLHNLREVPVGFKFKAKEPHRYEISPDYLGLLPPAGKQEITVTLKLYKKSTHQKEFTDAFQLVSFQAQGAPSTVSHQRDWLKDKFGKGCLTQGISAQVKIVDQDSVPEPSEPQSPRDRYPSLDSSLFKSCIATTPSEPIPSPLTQSIELEKSTPVQEKPEPIKFSPSGSGLRTSASSKLHSMNKAEKKPMKMVLSGVSQSTKSIEPTRSKQVTDEPLQVNLNSVFIAFLCGLFFAWLVRAR